MKLKFSSSLSNFNKFKPFDSPTSDAKPIDLSLKSRIKNFMKKSTNNEFKTSSDSINSIGSTNSSNLTNSFNNHHYNEARSKTSINNMCSNLINNPAIINVPPSPPNSIEEDEEDCFQQQLYLSQLMNKNYYHDNNNQQLTNLLSNTSQLNQTNRYHLNNNKNSADLLSIYSNQKQQIINDQLEYNLDRFTNKQSSINRIEPSLLQSAINEKSEHIHYQKQMVRKHISQSGKQRTQNFYNPYSQASKRKYGKLVIDENEEDELELDPD